MIYWERAGKILGILRNRCGNVQMTVDQENVIYDYGKPECRLSYIIRPSAWHEKRSEEWAQYILTKWKDYEK